MISEEDPIFASPAGSPSGLKLSFSQEPADVIGSREFIFSKVTLQKNSQQLALRFGTFTEYTNDNGITYTLEADNAGEMPLYLRLVEKDTTGKLHLVHNQSYEQVLIAHENECPACTSYKPCPKSSYHSISVAAEQSELMLYMQVNYLPESSSSVYHLLISTGDRNAYALSAPIKIVEELNSSNNSNGVKKKLIARHLRWLSDFLGSMLPDDDNAEDAWVTLDNAITHKLRGILALADDAPPPPLEDVEKLLLPLLKAIGQGQLGNSFPVQKQYFNGWTIGHFACALGFNTVVTTLKGVDVDVVDMNGRRARYYAILWGHKEIADLLNQRAKPKVAPRSPALPPRDGSVPLKPPGTPPRTTFVTPPKLGVGGAPLLGVPIPGVPIGVVPSTVKYPFYNLVA